MGRIDMTKRHSTCNSVWAQMVDEKKMNVNYGEADGSSIEEENFKSFPKREAISDADTFS